MTDTPAKAARVTDAIVRTYKAAYETYVTKVMRSRTVKVDPTAVAFEASRAGLEAAFASIAPDAEPVAPWRFSKGFDDDTRLALGADHIAYGIAVDDWENRIEVYGSEQLRDYVLARLMAPDAPLPTKDADNGTVQQHRVDSSAVLLPVAAVVDPAKDAVGEAWQPIERWHGRYLVSSAGRVRQYGGRILKQWPNSQGYMLVRLSKPRKVERVHRLVAETFISNPAAKPYVNHINNNRSDNNAENLEWCTQQENLAHADKQGRMQRDYWVGKRSPNAKLAVDDILEIRAAYGRGGISWEALGRKYGISKRSVGRILNGEYYADIR